MASSNFAAAVPGREVNMGDGRWAAVAVIGREVVAAPAVCVAEDGRDLAVMGREGEPGYAVVAMAPGRDRSASSLSSSARAALGESMKPSVMSQTGER